MPNASVAAAATGLPETTDDFHLNIGREIARVAAAMDRIEGEIETRKVTKEPGTGIFERDLEHIFDREEALFRFLATSQAQSLAGATVQLAAAVKLFGWVTQDQDPRPAEERAIKRLLASALTVMVDAAGVDPARDGISYLADPHQNPWRDSAEIVAELFPEGGETK